MLNSLWYHLPQREKVALGSTVYRVDTVYKKEPIDKTIKVTETNRKRLNITIGELMHDGENHVVNDAINYLFDCKEKLEKMLKEPRENTIES